MCRCAGDVKCGAPEASGADADPIVAGIADQYAGDALVEAVKPSADPAETSGVLVGIEHESKPVREAPCAEAASRWQKIAIPAFASALPRPYRHLFVICAPTGSCVHAATSPKPAVSTVALRIIAPPFEVPSSRPAKATIRPSSPARAVQGTSWLLSQSAIQPRILSQESTPAREGICTSSASKPVMEACGSSADTCNPCNGERVCTSSE
jgi:hypothetical protein